MSNASLSPRRTQTIVAALVALSALLRVINVNAELWFDEIVTVINFVHAPFAQVVTSYGLANNHVMNSVLTNLVGAWFGTSPWLLRLPAVLFGIGGVYAFWFVASALWRAPAALAGTGLFAVSYHHIYYSQNARGYSALIFFGLVATGCLLRLVRDHESERSWHLLAAYALAAGLGLYAMLLMTFIVAGHGAVLLWTRRWRALAALAAGLAFAGLLYAPMAGSLVAYYRTHPSDTGYPLLSMDFLRAIAPLAPLLPAGALVLPLLWRLWRRQPVAAALLLAPIAFNVLVPLLRGQGVYPRSFIYGLPVAFLVLVEAIDWASTRLRISLQAAALAIVVALQFVKLVPFYRLPKQGFREALAYIDANSRAGDRRLGITLGGKAARFYDDRYTLIEDEPQLREATQPALGPAWIVSTFAAEMRGSQPAVDAWLHMAADDRAEFPGVIGDGTVHVHYWAGATATPR